MLSPRLKQFRNEKKLNKKMSQQETINRIFFEDKFISAKKKDNTAFMAGYDPKEEEIAAAAGKTVKNLGARKSMICNLFTLYLLASATIAQAQESQIISASAIKP